MGFEGKERREHESTHEREVIAKVWTTLHIHTVRTTDVVATKVK
jgi:hypothetical protein